MDAAEWRAQRRARRAARQAARLAERHAEPEGYPRTAPQAGPQAAPRADPPDAPQAGPPDAPQAAPRADPHAAPQAGPQGEAQPGQPPARGAPSPGAPRAATPAAPPGRAVAPAAPPDTPPAPSPPPEGFRAHTAPLRFGDPDRGRLLVAGRLPLAGGTLRLAGPDPWTAPLPPAAAAALHGFDWLDDLAALGDRAACETAQRWLAGWIARFGKRRRTGWAPEAVGHRLGRWLDHAPLLLAGPGRDAPRFLAAAEAQARVLSTRWQAAPAGLPRFRALAALLRAGLLLRGQEALAGPALAGLARECDSAIDAAGGLASRNPEELLDALTLLVGVAEALEAVGRPADPALSAAILRMAPTLRALRHADGGLARFHGGGRGPEGLADLVLAAAGPRTPPRRGTAMGFVRLAARRTSVIVDAAAPPPGAGGHASTLAFELTSGRRPLIVSTGAGHAFGPDWRRAARATAAHATLAIEGWSSSRLGPRARGSDADAPDLAQRPGTVTLAREGEGPTAGLAMGHDGYGTSHGLVHLRRLALGPDGRTLLGEDALVPTTPEQRRRLDAVLAQAGPAGIAFSVRFPLHPDVSAALDPTGSLATLWLRSGEAWVLRAEGALPVLEPAVYLDAGRPAPRPTLHLVLAGRLTGPGAQIVWTLAKTQDTPLAIRDLPPDDMPP